MADFFFRETFTCDVENAYFFYGSRFLKNLSKEVLMSNKACLKIRVPSSTTYIKTYEVFFSLN